MILLKSKQYMLIGLTAVALTLTACGGDSAKNGTGTTSNDNTSGQIKPDTDGDGVPDIGDNCPTTFNPNQNDLDEDRVGDLCDPDIDGDNILNSPDNCPTVSNENQIDSNNNGIGDACEGDQDGDGIKDSEDNCPTTPNNPNTDSDGNNIGDACQDSDSDGILDTADNCPMNGNPSQADQDQDGVGDVCDSDTDGDGKLNAMDNCPFVFNPGQENSDSTPSGDACENDSDNDGILNTVDNCRFIPNADQKDQDGDGLGDVCDDSDSDGLFDNQDNCPQNANNDQADQDRDGLGDVCDIDRDGDGVSNSVDNCPLVNNPPINGIQPDKDGDGKGDACDGDTDNDSIPDDVDNCPLTPNTNQADFNESNIPGVVNTGDACSDEDGDEIFDDKDNCPLVSNVNQGDIDGDGIGDVCDPDRDGDNVANDDDNCPSLSNADQKDSDNDGKGDLCDTDQDGDGVKETDGDNCPLTPNRDQLDSDKDGVGDACDTDGFTCGTGTATPTCPAVADLKTGYSCTGFAPTGSVAVAVKQGGLCSLSNLLLNGSLVDICGVDSPASAADGNGETFAKVNNAVALADSLFTDGALTGKVGISVTLPQKVAAGKLAAFKISVPRSLVELSLAKAITVTTDGGESFGGPDQTGGFALELLTAGYDGNVDPLGVDNLAPGSVQPLYVLGGFATKAFQTLTITVGGGLSADLGTSIEVYDVCTDISASTTNTIGDGSSPLPSIGGDSGGNNNPLGVITTPLGDALAPVTGALSALTVPLADGLDGTLGQTPLAPLSNGVVDLIDGTGEAGGEPGNTPGIPTSPEEFMALLGDNPITAALETLAAMIPGADALPGADSLPAADSIPGADTFGDNPLGVITTPLGDALAPATDALSALTVPLADGLDSTLGQTPLAPLSNGVVDLINGTRKPGGKPGNTPGIPPGLSSGLPPGLTTLPTRFLALLPANP